MDQTNHLHWRSFFDEDSPTSPGPREGGGGLFDEPTPLGRRPYQDPLASPTSTMVFSSNGYETPQATKPGAIDPCQKLGSAKGRTATKKIEVSPGCYMRLRGADETYAAIKKDSYVPTTCYVCMNTILCIDSAEHVLCPDCKVVSPVREDSYGSADPSVGLGFTLQQLSNFIEEIEGTQTPQQKLFAPL